MQINWKLKSLLYKVLKSLPSGTLYVVQRYITGRSKVRVNEISQNWIFHEDNISKSDAKKLIEFGAGKSLVQNLYLSTLPIEQTLVDLFRMVDLDQVNDAINGLVKLGVEIDGRPVGSLEELKEIYRIDYQAPVDMRQTHFESDSFDVCISTNTLEHISRPDIEKISNELYRILKPGGCISAKIDYSDHYSHTDKKIGPHNFLKFTPSQWAKFNHDNHFQNRLRHGHFKTLFKDCGFELSASDARDFHKNMPDEAIAELLCNDGDDEAVSGYFHLIVPA